MTKIITIPEFQIDDVVPKIKTIQVFYSAPGSQVSKESLYIDIDRDNFNEWLENSGHLNQPFTAHIEGEPDQEVDVTIPVEDFFLEDNSFTWPIIKEYVELHHWQTPFDGISGAINSIMSHFKQ